jgi:hypothetical protein
MLVVREYGTGHYRVRKSIPVHVENQPPTLDVSGVVSYSTVAGTVTLNAKTNAKERIGLNDDGRATSRDAKAPYTLTWDTTSASEGQHTLLVVGRDRYGHRSSERIAVVVANAPLFPAALSPAELARDEHATAFSLAD